jgi:cytochrome P450
MRNRSGQCSIDRTIRSFLLYVKNSFAYVPEKSLQSVMADLFLAGTDTTSTTLTWATLYLLHYPDVQTRLQDELDRVVGGSRLPTLSDKKR